MSHYKECFDHLGNRVYVAKRRFWLGWVVLYAMIILLAAWTLK